ncbi:hypothetical protein ACFWPP_37570 [Streptomyces anulatus]|uniref:hypothetical protein n=1 Tax=Streptomyces TaxID=1883 RepID=UPI000AB377C7|nr:MULTISPECIES: hypothetical protein [unclassified Streptomyces]QNQ37719.1 hypothetical protein HYC88_31135 [Streptomyces sp. CB00271]
MTGPAAVMHRPAAAVVSRPATSAMNRPAPAAATRPALLPHPHVFRTEESQP